MKLERIQKQHPPKTEKGTVLLVHGACLGAWYWSDNFIPNFFEKGYNVIALNLRNHGRSENNGKLRFTSVMDYVEDVRQIVYKIDGPVFIVGHSMGGFVLQHYLKTISDNIKGIVLLCSVPSHGLWGLVGRLLVDYPFHFLHSFFSMSWLPIIKNKTRLKRVMFSSNFPDEKMGAIVNSIQDESFLAFLEMVFLRLPPQKKSPVPIMVVGAEKDYLISENDTRKMAATFAVDPLIIKDASHCFIMEEGWESTAENISQFFDQH